MPVVLTAGTAVLLLASCASPRASGVRYSPPSAAPVRDWITSAQGHAKAAKTAIAHAEKSVRSGSAPVSGAGEAVSGSRTSILLADLAAADSEIDALTNELLNSQTALSDYEKKVAEQTEIANTALDDKNTAIKQRDDEKAKTASVAKREHYFFLLLSAALIWIFRTPLLYLAKLLLALITKIPI